MLTSRHQSTGECSGTQYAPAQQTPFDTLQSRAGGIDVLGTPPLRGTGPQVKGNSKSGNSGHIELPNRISLAAGGPHPTRRPTKSCD